MKFSTLLVLCLAVGLLMIGYLDHRIDTQRQACDWIKDPSLKSEACAEYRELVSQKKWVNQKMDAVISWVSAR